MKKFVSILAAALLLISMTASFASAQKIGGDHIYGKSITDPCLGWEDSEKLLYTIAEMC